MYFSEFCPVCHRPLKFKFQYYNKQPTKAFCSAEYGHTFKFVEVGSRRRTYILENVYHSRVNLIIFRYAGYQNLGSMRILFHEMIDKKNKKYSRNYININHYIPPPQNFLEARRIFRTLQAFG